MQAELNALLRYQRPSDAWEGSDLVRQAANLRRPEVQERDRENWWRSQARAGLRGKQHGISERGTQPDGVAEREQ